MVSNEYFSGTNDAFVTIALGKEKFQTSVKEKSSDPVEWSEQCELYYRLSASFLTFKYSQTHIAGVFHHTGIQQKYLSPCFTGIFLELMSFLARLVCRLKILMSMRDLNLGKKASET